MIKASVRAINPNKDVTENQETRNESQKQRSWGMGERGAVVEKKNDARTICEDLDIDALVNYKYEWDEAEERDEPSP